ncbi:hypothetical protein VPNG_09362 [Cytospora leucostoma]|uniref:Uncharacterized protein n=1 Tax=Cytospora leucostoma TaxID=1230097 RepID=A0A423VT07_9PEZI|nr:hypothetical protein VPNG_09362 [Cytospora leucostoma]
MPFKNPRHHHMVLRDIFIEGRRRPFSDVATLTLKDGDSSFGSFPTQTPTTASAITNRPIMQVHVDGTTLAQWDLNLVTERNMPGAGAFSSSAPSKMLQLKLPLAERRFESQSVGNTPHRKTIELYMVSHEDFHTAVSYLSKHAGLQHIDLHKEAAPFGSLVLEKTPILKVKVSLPWTKEHTFEAPRVKKVARSLQPLATAAKKLITTSILTQRAQPAQILRPEDPVLDHNLGLVRPLSLAYQ